MRPIEIMSLPGHDNLGIARPPFWDRFQSLVPDIVRCRFLAKAVQIADGRAAEFKRERGPALPAIKSTHLKRAIQRLNELKGDIEVLKTFYPESALSDPCLDPVFKIIAKFEERFVHPLDEVAKNGDEANAQAAVKSARRVVVEIARLAEKSFDSTIEELEQRIVPSVLYHGSLIGFVSCVSLDLAQYGAHARVVHNYTESPGVLDLNRRLQREVEVALKVAGVPLEEVIKIDTGDGAIVIFVTGQAEGKKVVTDRAFRFSSAFLNAIAKGNDQIDVENQLHFRIGICSGMVAMDISRVRRSEITQCRAGGVAIGTAVRLQSAARTGEIVVCAATWKELCPETQDKFNTQQQICGKIHEKVPILAHSWQCTPPRPEERVA